MIILSQDKKMIITLDELSVVTPRFEVGQLQIEDGVLNVIGRYPTEERCMEVLEDITICVHKGHAVYKMPKE